MNSIKSVVQAAYGEHGEPRPQFRCPVVLDPKVVKVFGQQRDLASQLIEEAAHAADMVGRFGDGSEYVDFCPLLTLSEGELPIGMRAQVVRAKLGNVVRIDFLASAKGIH